MLLLFPPSGFYHILKAMLEGPINGFWLSPTAGINIELQECAAWWWRKWEEAVLFFGQARCSFLLSADVPHKAACHFEKCAHCTISQLERLSKHLEQCPTAFVLSLMSADKGLLKKACKEIKGLQVEVEQLKFSVPSVVNYQWQI